MTRGLSCGFVFEYHNIEMQIFAIYMSHVVNRGFSYDFLYRQFPMKMLQPRNPPNRATQIPRYLKVQIQIENLVEFEFVPRNLGIAIWWISGV